MGSAKGLRKAQRAAGPPEGQRMPKARRDSPADPQAAYACFLVAMTQVDRTPPHTHTHHQASLGKEGMNLTHKNLEICGHLLDVLPEQKRPYRD